MTSSDILLVRADAGVRIGTGHAMRCLALAQAWQDAGGRAIYCMAAHSEGIDSRLRGENVHVVHIDSEPGSDADALALIETAGAHGKPWVVVDGYHFTAQYHARLKRAGLRVLLVDDLGELEHYSADLILNQDPIAEEGLYSRRETTSRLLLGTKYAMLRREFYRHSTPRRNAPEIARRLLITLGGADPDNVSELVIRSLAMAAVDNLDAVVLVGPNNFHIARLEAAAKSQRGAVRLLSNPPNIPELMAWCDVAVTAGGSTLWELAYFAVPCLVLVIAANQARCAKRLQDLQACRALDGASIGNMDVLGRKIGELLASAALRAELSRKFSSLVDGRGAQRVCGAMCA